MTSDSVSTWFASLWNSFGSLLESEQSWIIQVFFVVFVTMVVHYFEGRIYKKLHAKLEKTPSIWDESLITAFHKPIGLLIWVVGLTYAMELTSHYTPAVKIFELMPNLRQAGIVLLITWFLLRFVKSVEQSYLHKAKTGEGAVDITTASAVSQITRVSVMITAALVILPIFDIKITGLLFTGGAATLVMGLAAKDLLANFFGAITIYLDRPFAVGDWIKSPDKQIEGTVEYIGWRLTRIRTFDKQPLYVPNSLFSTISIQNPSRMQNRRIKEIVGIRYKDSAALDKITAEIKDMLLNHPEIDTTKACFVNLISFGPSSLDLLVYTFTKTTAWIPFQGIKQDVMLKILDIIHKHNADVAFPTRTIEVEDSELLPEMAKT